MAALVVLTPLVAVLEPATLSDPRGGLVKNLAIFGCALTVWTLGRIVPRRTLG
jgi:hypothetical protein